MINKSLATQLHKLFMIRLKRLISQSLVSMSVSFSGLAELSVTQGLKMWLYQYKNDSGCRNQGRLWSHFTLTFLAPPMASIFLKKCHFLVLSTKPACCLGPGSTPSFKTSSECWREVERPLSWLVECAVIWVLAAIRKLSMILVVCFVFSSQGSHLSGF